MSYQLRNEVPEDLEVLEYNQVKMMVFKFNDVCKTIKPLAIILETSSYQKTNCLLIKQVLGNVMSLDLLNYKDNKTLNRDIENLYKKLNEYYKSEEEKKTKIGFAPSLEGEDDGHEDEQDDECDE